MKDIIGYILLTLSAVVLMIGLGFAFSGADFFLYKTFAPKYEQARRETFEQSKAYNQGMIQELQNMQFQYVQAKPEQKEALAFIILHRAADFDENQLPADLKIFINKLRNTKEIQ